MSIKFNSALSERRKVPRPPSGYLQASDSTLSDGLKPAFPHSAWPGGLGLDPSARPWPHISILWLDISSSPNVPVDLTVSHWTEGATPKHSPSAVLRSPLLYMNICFRKKFSLSSDAPMNRAPIKMPTAKPATSVRIHNCVKSS